MSNLRTIDQIIAVADGGEFRDELYGKVEALLEEMERHRTAYERGTKAKIALDISFEVDRFGEMEIRLSSKFTWPAPPNPAGRARAYLGDDGTLETHPQSQMQLRDISRAAPETRDPATSKG